MAAVSYSQEGNTFSGLDVAQFKPQTDIRIAALSGAGAAQMGVFPAGQFYDLYIWIWAGIKQAGCDQICFSHVAAVSSEAVPPGSAVVQLLVPPAQSALLTTATTAPAPQVQFFLFFFFFPLLFHAITSFGFFMVSVFKQVEIVGKPQPATPSQPATPGTEHELQQYRKLCGKIKNKKTHRHYPCFWLQLCRMCPHTSMMTALATIMTLSQDCTMTLTHR